jgi:hypothetical protein
MDKVKGDKLKGDKLKEALYDEIHAILAEVVIGLQKDKVIPLICDNKVLTFEEAKRFVAGAGMLLLGLMHMFQSLNNK